MRRQHLGETWLVLGVSLGASAVWSLLRIVDRLTRAESLGSELFVYFQTVGTEASPGIVGAELGDQVETPALAREALTARLHRGSQVEPGATARLTVDTSRLYLFDPETGRALI